MIIESIKKQNTDNGVRLTAQITSDRQSFEIWYEASSEIGYYFCDERADAFVVALMPYAMSIGEDIISNVPISAQLKHSLVKSQIPYMVKLSQKYHNISIISEINSDKLESANHVGTSISCGVDSLSTLVWEGLLADESRYKIDSLTLFNAGHYGNNQEISEKKFSVHFQNATDF